MTQTHRYTDLSPAGRGSFLFAFAARADYRVGNNHAADLVEPIGGVVIATNCRTRREKSSSVILGYGGRARRT